MSNISKKILFGKEALNEIQTGMNTVANVGKVTIGPRGRNVMVDRGIMSPGISNDGLEAIRTIILKNRAQNMGADIIRDVVIKTNDKAKGSRTASIILTQSIFNNGIDYMENGVNAIAIKRGIEKGASAVIEKLKEKAIKVTSMHQVKAVATISSEMEDVGDAVSKVFDKVGVNGLVAVEESPSTQGITIETVEGMKIDKGWINPGMVTNFNKMEAEYDNIGVMILDKKMIQIRNFLPLQEKIVNAGMGEIFIVAEDIEGEALETFVANNFRGGFKTVAIKSPGFGVEKQQLLEDIAIATGAKIISDERGNPLETASIDSIGFAKKVVVGRNETILVSNPQQKEKINERILNLKEQLKDLKSNIDIKNMESRISKMSEGVGLIKVGAATESGMKYLKDKTTDAVNEARNAMEEGFVAGGGIELVKIASELNAPENSSEEDVMGYDIIKKSIMSPARQIIINAGKDDKKIIDYIIENKGEYPNIGYDAVSDNIVNDMIESGIIDSVKVMRIALQNAAEAAATALTVEAIVCDEIVEKDK